MAEAWTARGRSGRPDKLRDRAVSALVVVASSLLAALITFLLFAPPFGDVAESPSQREPVASSANAAPSSASGRHLNADGGYSFLHPAGWTVVDDGTVSELVSPEGDVVISFGVGQAGTLRRSAAALVRSIERRYQDVELQRVERTVVDGRPAAVVSGRLINDDEVELRFLGVSLRTGGENHVIAVFVSDLVEPLHVLAPIEQVIVSLDTVEA